MIERAIEGINVNEETIGLDVIKKVATSEKKGVNFLAEKHTRDHMKKELYFPILADRNRRSTWYKKGAKDIIFKAQEKVEMVLKNHHLTDWPKNIENDMLNYIKMVEARSFDDYKKAEGLTADSITLPDGIEIRKEND